MCVGYMEVRSRSHKQTVSYFEYDVERADRRDVKLLVHIIKYIPCNNYKFLIKSRIQWCAIQNLNGSFERMHVCSSYTSVHSWVIEILHHFSAQFKKVKASDNQERSCSNFDEVTIKCNFFICASNFFLPIFWFDDIPHVPTERVKTAR